MKRKRFKMLGVVGASAVPITAVTLLLMGQTKAMPIKGWQPEYTDFVEAKISATPEILSYRKMDIIPGWEKKPEKERVQSFSNVVRCMAQAESNNQRLQMYRELKISGRDSVTGLGIVSEGLLQISYSDMKNYGGDCKFDWAKDRPAFLKDIKQSGQEFMGTDGRSILDPFTNLACGVEIMRKLLVKHPQSARYAIGRYWAVMRPERSGYQRLKQCLEAK